MKTLTKFILTTMLFATTLPARAERWNGTLRQITSETPLFNMQLTVAKNPIYVYINAAPLKKIVLKIVAIHPDGRPLATKQVTVEMPASVPYGYFKVNRIRGLFTSPHVRYTFTVAPANGKPTDVFWKVTEYIAGHSAGIVTYNPTKGDPRYAPYSGIPYPTALSGAVWEPIAIR